MANLYGVANPCIIPVAVGLIGGANINCPANTETNIIASPPLIAISAGYYYPMVWAYLGILIGATNPTNLVVSIRLGAGSDMDGAVIPPQQLVGNAFIVDTFPLVGSASQAAYTGAGSILNVTINPTAQPVTAELNPSRAVIALFRAPDQ